MVVSGYIFNHRPPTLAPLGHLVMDKHLVINVSTLHLTQNTHWGPWGTLVHAMEQALTKPISAHLMEQCLMPISMDVFLGHTKPIP
jgi:hypothetical protein